MTEAPRRIVHIDGACALCNGLARFVRRRDRHSLFEFIPDNQTESVRLVEDGRTYERSTAALRVLLPLGLPWSWLGRIGLTVPAGVRDAIYDWIARRRRGIQCRVD